MSGHASKEASSRRSRPSGQHANVRTRAEAKADVFDNIEGFYNHPRRTLVVLSPSGSSGRRNYLGGCQRNRVGQSVFLYGTGFNMVGPPKNSRRSSMGRCCCNRNRADRWDSCCFCGTAPILFLPSMAEKNFEPHGSSDSIRRIVIVGGLGGYIWDRSRGPIIWDWSKNWIGYTYGHRDPVIGIVGFQFHGWNRWDDPVTIKTASVRSDITGELDQIIARPTQRFGLGEETEIISADAHFQLIGIIRGGDNASNRITAEDFRKDFGRFSVHSQFGGN